MILRPTLVFDLDGTLADTAPDLMGTLNFILEREGVAPLPVDSARRLLGAGACALIVRGFAQAGRGPPDRLEQLYEDFLVHYEAHVADASQLFPGVIAALDRLAGARFRLAVCTNKIERPAHLLLRALGVHDRFAAICGQDTFGVAKPDPRMFFETVARAGGDPARAVMIGDSTTDIATARAAGVPVIAVDFGYTDVPVAELRPDRVISHFDQLWDAIALLPAPGTAAAP